VPTSPASPFGAVAVGSQLPRSLRGEVSVVAMGTVADFDVKQDMGSMVGGSVNARRGFESLYEPGIRDLPHGAGRDTFDAVKMLKNANPHRFAPENGAQYARGTLGESLKQIAQLIKADVGLELAFADMGGWGTHANQGNEKGQLARRLTELSQSLAALYRDLGDRMADVVVVTMSDPALPRVPQQSCQVSRGARVDSAACGKPWRSPPRFARCFGTR